ncbi:MAG: tetratricopeptide repeat protein [Caldimonas sp.]
MRLALATIFALTAVTHAAAADEFESGLRAYNKHEWIQAAQLLRKASDRGDARAQVAPGLMYSKGEGVARDDRRAVELFRLAAGQSHPIAQYSLASAYANGKGVAQDFAQARSWYERAAQQGLARAQLNLGVLYYNGNGVARDFVEADKWFVIAGTHGATEAAGARSEVESRMTAEQIAEATKRATAWSSDHRR